MATELGAASVVFPAVSAGVYGWPHADAARIAVETVRAAPYGGEVSFALTPTMLPHFERALAESL